MEREVPVTLRSPLRSVRARLFSMRTPRERCRSRSKRTTTALLANTFGVGGRREKSRSDFSISTSSVYFICERIRLPPSTGSSGGPWSVRAPSTGPPRLSRKRTWTSVIRADMSIFLGTIRSISTPPETRASPLFSFPESESITSASCEKEMLPVSERATPRRAREAPCSVLDADVAEHGGVLRRSAHRRLDQVDAGGVLHVREQPRESATVDARAQAQVEPSVAGPSA